MRKLLLVVGILNIAIVCLAGWVAWRVVRIPRRLPAVPMELATRAVIPGIPGARYFVGVDIEPFVKDVLTARQREIDELAKNGQTGPLPPADLLAVSGGGDNGAFGAGLLCGWTARGNRPTFKAVTGVSTGALIAPFAYLGTGYDDVLRQVYTSVKPTDIAERRSFLAAIDNDGMADNLPLWGLISKFIDQKFLEKVAAEHAKGRSLLIGTTNLDARQPVIWNMGVIASSGAPGALNLFRRILLASAAIPGAFPPSMFPVEVDGKPYEEMHVDGGASAQVFLYPPSLRSVAASMGADLTRQRELRVYIIRNAELKATWQPVERRTMNIAGRAIASLIHTQGIGDLYRIYVTTQRDGLDFNLAYIGPDFTYQGVKKEEFDTPYMQALFDYAFKLGKDGYPWKKLPPGLDAPLGKPAGS
jgi:predicted acylesterase/phospholipase RssA